MFLFFLNVFSKIDNFFNWDLINNQGFFAIFGVIIGFLLSWAWEYYKTNRLKRNVRTLIYMELKYNKATLKKYLDNIDFSNNELEIVCPNVSLKYWDKLMIKIPDFFNNAELESLFIFYNKLNNLINNNDLWINFVFDESKNNMNSINLVESSITNQNFNVISENKQIIYNEIIELLNILNDLEFNN